MKYVREKCVLCSSSRKIDKIRKYSNYNICELCINKNKKLKSYIKEYDKLLNGDYLRNIKNEIGSEEYSKNKNADEKIVSLIEEIIQTKKDKSKIKRKILRKVKSEVTDENRNNVDKTLNSFSINDLEECETSLKNAKNIVNFKDNIIIKKKIDSLEIPNPISIIDNFNEHIIDQEEAINSVSLSLIQHLCRKKDPLIPKNNILLLGPTGTGKTEIARVMSKFLNIPLVIIDSTSLTSEGYVGASLSDSIINALMFESNGDQEIAENSIVFIDEIDKKATSKSNVSEINTLSIQNELLKILEGTNIRGQIQDGKNSKKISLNTNNILFICAGAFSNLDNIINKKNKRSIGLNQGENNFIEIDNFSNIETSDLVEYGLTPEFLGRFSTITYTKKLTDESLYKVLKLKKNSIVDQYQRIFKQFNVNIEFTDDFLYSIIREAQEEEVGARGLYRIFSKKIKPILINVYSFIKYKQVKVKKDKLIFID